MLGLRLAIRTRQKVLLKNSIRFFNALSQPQPNIKPLPEPVNIKVDLDGPQKRITPIDLTVKNVAHLLPHQPILENFIHHNPLRHFEWLPFHSALDHVRWFESYKSPGERFLELTHVDPRKRVNESLSDLCSSFLDKGAAKWTPGFRDKGFLYFFASLEGLGFAPWRKHARQVAQRILNTKNNDLASLALPIIQENLEFFGIPPEDWERAIFSMLSELRGWAGMFERMESHPNEVPPHTTVRLLDFCAVQSILSRSSIEALARQLGWKESKQPFHVFLSKILTLRVDSSVRSSVHDFTPHDSSIAYVDQNAERREALELEFEHALLHSIGIPQNK